MSLKTLYLAVLTASFSVTGHAQVPANTQAAEALAYKNVLLNLGAKLGTYSVDTLKICGRQRTPCMKRVNESSVAELRRIQSTQGTALPGRHIRLSDIRDSSGFKVVTVVAIIENIEPGYDGAQTYDVVLDGRTLQAISNKLVVSSLIAPMRRR